MKLNDVLGENELNEIVGLAKGAAKLAMPFTKNPNAVTTIPYTSGAQAVKAGVRTAKALGHTGKGTIDKFMKKMLAGKELRRFEVAKAEYRRNLANMVGNAAMGIFLALGIANDVADYKAAKAILDQNPPADYDAQLARLRGLLITKILAPGVGMLAAKGLTAIPKVVLSGLQILGPAKWAGAAVTGKAGLEILEKLTPVLVAGYLSTEKGQQLIVDWLGGIIDGAGIASNFLVKIGEFLYATAQVAGVIPSTTGPASTSQPAAQTPSPSGSATAPSSGTSVPTPSVGGASSVDDLALQALMGMIGKK